MLRPTRTALCVILAITMIGPIQIGTHASGQSADSGADSGAGHDALFVDPHGLSRIVEDPWRGGAWIATLDIGVLFRSDAGAIHHYEVRDGLPEYMVFDVAPTPKHVFFATLAGVAVLDKADNTIQPVVHEDGSSFDTLSRSVFPEGDHAWIGTDDRGLFRVSSEFTAESVPNPMNGSRFQDPIMGFAARGSELFISVADYGLVRWDRETGDAQKYNMSLVVGRPIYRDVGLTASDAWVATSGDGVIEYDLETGEGREHRGPNSFNTPLNVWGMEITGSEAWFATDNGVVRHDLTEDTWKTYQPNTGYNYGTTFDVSLVNGTLYAVTQPGWLVRYDRTTDTWEPAEWWTDERTLPWNTITGCTSFQDKLAFSTGGQASTYFDPSTQQFSRVGEEPDVTGEGPPDMLHWSILGDAENLWVGTVRGLAKYDAAENQWSDHRSDGGEPRKRPGETVRDISSDEETVWIATNSVKKTRVGDQWKQGHLAGMDRATGTWTNYSKEDGLAGPNVTSVLSHDGRVFAGLHLDGLDVVDLEAGTIEHLYPPDDTDVTVRDIIAHNGTVWAAASTGLLRVDPETHTVEPIDAFQDTALASLLWHAGSLWVGTQENGLARYDPGSGEAVFLDEPATRDRFIYCMVPHDGILYIGTQRGLDRFHLTEGVFLPKDAAPSLDPASLGDEPDASPGAWISITEPTPGDAMERAGTLTVEGTALGPNGSIVNVRLGSETRTLQLEDQDRWRADIPLTDQSTGRNTISARLLLDGAVLAQDATTIHLRSSDHEGSEDQSQEDVVPIHDPVATVPQHETRQIEVRTQPVVDGLEGVLLVRPPNGDAFEEHTLASNGTGWLIGELPAPSEVGTGTYRIKLSWPGGDTTLPQDGSPFGESYTYHVEPAKSVATPSISESSRKLTVPSGGSATIELNVQNTGSRAGTWSVSLSNIASAWVRSHTERVTIQPGTSEAVVLEFDLEQATEVGPYPLQLALDPGESAAVRPLDTTLTVEVVDPQEDEPAPAAGAGEEEPDGVPGPGVWLVMGSVIFIAIAASAQEGRRKS